MRAVIYARYSSDLQSDASIEDQVRLCKERIAREGWTLTATYADRRLSGASQLRPGYQKLLADTRSRQFDVVLAEALDRISRDQEHVAAFYKQLTFAGVKLVTLAEGEISELHVGLKGTMNAVFLKDLADKTRRGLRGRIEAGRFAGGLCYGYTLVREIGSDGELIRGKRQINEAEAQVVRRIFKAFATGRSPRAVARELNAAQVPGPGGRPWSDTTIRGHHCRGTGILRNELYAGHLVWNRLRYVKDPATGRRLSRANPREEWIIEEVPGLRIIPQPLWDSVQARLSTIRDTEAVRKARATRFWEHRRAQYLLTGKVYCGYCGGAYAAIGKDYLGCSRARRQSTCDGHRGVRRAVLEDLILGALKTNLMAPELIKEFIEAFHAAVNDERRKQELDRTRVERQLAETTRKLDGLILAIADGLRAPGLQQKLDELEHRKAALETELTKPAPSPVRLLPNLGELYRDKVQHLRTALEAPETRDEALGILRELVDRVVVTPKTKGAFEIELVGEIANMVELALGTDRSKTKAAPRGAALSTEHRSSVKVVAGRGFEPLTFRL